VFVICKIDGYEISGRWRSLDAAIEAAKDRLEDDPELGELTIWEFDENGNFSYHVRTVTFGPDANWDSIVVVLMPGEQIQPPGPVPRRISEEDLDGYDLGDPKRAYLESRLGE
jgi:hypothetical protein